MVVNALVWLKVVGLRINYVLAHYLTLNASCCGAALRYDLCMYVLCGCGAVNV